MTKTVEPVDRRAMIAVAAIGAVALILAVAAMCARLAEYNAAIAPV